MAMRPVLEWDLFPEGEDHKLSQQKLLFAYEALCRANQEYLRAHPETPLLYESGIRYQVEPPGHEDWADIPNIIRNGWGDCEDLGGWMVAECRERLHIPAKPFLRWRRKAGEYAYHALLCLPASWRTGWEIVKVPAGPEYPGTLIEALNPDGSPQVRRCRVPVFDKRGGGFVFEDPSARLGMYQGRINIANAYQEIKAKGADPMAQGPRRGLPGIPPLVSVPSGPLAGMPLPMARAIIHQARMRRRMLGGGF